MSIPMANEQQKRSSGTAGESGEAQPVGDNRRAGDTDGNSAGGNSQSKGPTNPADPPEDSGPADKKR
jgi:hypothetical protein